jgi:hypothetical protein
VPIARYFMVVGSVLIALLLIAGWSLPEPPPSFRDRPASIDRAIIRIRSDRKWPEKIVLDTNQPMLPPLSIEVATAQQWAEPLPDEMLDQTSVEAPAKPNPDARPLDAHHKPARPKSRTARAFPSTHVARARNRNALSRLAAGEECCRSVWADRPEMSKAASRRRVARRDSWMGWHFMEAN